MRLWSIHPQYLDAKGLVALWREGLLAQAVLAGRTKGYRNHPQLTRFLQSSAPESYIAAYLSEVHNESLRRGYRFDGHKIGSFILLNPLSVTRGQIEYEWSHLSAKLRQRAPDWLRHLKTVEHPVPHPIFRVIKGGIAPWEVVVESHPVQNESA
jgi:Pyrimidine dimer DNA glycosylase